MPTKLHLFLINSFSVIAQTDIQTDRRVDADKINNLFNRFAGMHSNNLY